MATSWSYVPNDVYKPSRELIHTLVDIVAKGGNFLLNIGVSPKGEFAPDAYDRLRDIGAWMRVNSEAIYNTRPIAPYSEGKLRFTSLQDGTIYAIYLANENEQSPPAQIKFSGISPKPGAHVTLLGTKAPLKWKTIGSETVIDIPESFRSDPPGKYAWTIRISR
jgi:alpha-L-fucosidase